MRYVGFGLVALWGVCMTRIAMAQTPEQRETPVWRCGNSYSHQPCDAGHAVATQDPRTPAQREQAQDQQRRLNALLASREAQRAAQEAQQRKEAADAQRAQIKAQRAQRRAARQAETAQTTRKKRHIKPTSQRKTVVPRAERAAN
ncbi:MAG: hypothetical protein B7Z83_06625 [Thiomonas sp. 20-64-5]|nr:MAG: hypothetical protein B7Z83_06625 [Thiomonas sp. 20-64-5]